jgi:hypothetical protein
LPYSGALSGACNKTAVFVAAIVLSSIRAFLLGFVYLRHKTATFFISGKVATPTLVWDHAAACKAVRDQNL